METFANIVVIAQMKTMNFIVSLLFIWKSVINVKY